MQKELRRTRWSVVPPVTILLDTSVLAVRPDGVVHLATLLLRVEIDNLVGRGCDIRDDQRRQYGTDLHSRWKPESWRYGASILEIRRTARSEGNGSFRLTNRGESEMSAGLRNDNFAPREGRNASDRRL